MHEASIIQYALNAVERAAEENHITNVTEITLVIGKLKRALPHVMQYLFGILTRDTMFAHTVLTIEERDIIIRCPQCGEERTVEWLPQDCPACHSPAIEVVQGNELMIANFRGQ